MNGGEMVKALDLLFAHKYRQARELYDEVLAQPSSCRDGDRTIGALAGKARCLLCLNQVSDSLELFDMARRLDLQTSLPGESPYILEIATTQWLAGLLADSIETLTEAVDGILDGTIGYADQAGGVTQGALLWYAGLTTGDQAAQRHALKYLARIAKRKRIENWPGPIAQRILGKIQFEEVLSEAAGSSHLTECIAAASRNLLTRRQLCQALFYQAATKRAEGSEPDCREWMKKCYSLENPIIEHEWYLARNEVENSSPIGK